MTLITKHKGFGTKFNSLMDEVHVDFEHKSANITNILISKICSSSFQARKYFDDEAIEQLSLSIKALGVLCPILVRMISGNKFEVIAGERRWRAASLAGITSIPAIILSLSDEEAMAIGLIENIQRENLNIIEEAEAYNKLIKDFGLTHQQVSDKVNKSRSFITNCMRVLELPEKVKGEIIEGNITFGHAKALLSAPEKDRVALSNKLTNEKLSVRNLENLINNINDSKEYAQIINDVFISVGVEAKINKIPKDRYQMIFSNKSDMLRFINKAIS